MSRYVDPTRRRARRRVDGPIGDQPAELDPVHVSRVMRCPACRATIATMRRWQMLCSECGHAWEEETVLSAADRLADARSNLSEYAIMALMWGGLVGGVLLFIGIFVYLGLLITGGGSFVGVVLVALILLSLVASLGTMARHRDDALTRYWWFQRGRSDRF